MRLRHLIVITLGAVAVSAPGIALAQSQQQQNTVAHLRNLEGNVMVSQGDGMVAAANGLRVAPGTRVITLAGGSVVIDYDVGCDLSLKENQRFTVRTGECGALLAGVTTIVPGSTAITAAGFSIPAFLGGAAIGGGLVYAIRDRNCGEQASPN
ncbi:MAG: hypothetical protein IT522_12705 [Burkholderiales bacterium]|nr:hypothetical protein [Burkholderiales bacterium]